MNATKSTLKILIPFMAYLFIGCGKGYEAIQPEGGNSGLPNNGGVLSCLSAGGSAGCDSDSSLPSSSNSVEFKPDLNELTNYQFNHALNAPENFKVTVSLSDAGGGKYAGQVTVSYMDSGVPQVRSFIAQNRVNPSYRYMKDNNVHEAEYNRWFRLSNKDVFTGFFRDKSDTGIGSIVLVIDGMEDLGDAQGGDSLSGSVWYHNYKVATAPNSFAYRSCWFLYNGESPYYCRSNAVINKSGLEIDGYIKLGTFNGLSRAKAFE